MKREMIAGEVSLKYETYKLRSELVQVKSPEGLDKFIRPFFEDVINYKERMIAVYLNNHNKVLGVCTISEGGVTGTMCDSRLIFQTALLLNATGFIIVHNHPSGQLVASQQDKDITSTLQKCGEIMSITMLDSMIVTEEGYLSILNM